MTLNQLLHDLEKAGMVEGSYPDAIERLAQHVVKATTLDARRQLLALAQLENGKEWTDKVKARVTELWTLKKSSMNGQPSGNTAEARTAKPQSVKR